MPLSRIEGLQGAFKHNAQWDVHLISQLAYSLHRACSRLDVELDVA